MFLKVMVGMVGLGTGMAVSSAIYGTRPDFFSALGVGIVCGSMISILAYGLFSSEFEGKPQNPDD